ncbi:MAG TPA: molybdopterin cofactor-binding domain-containing protein, partial [Longimicrobiales bacterium]|nr:molybdopterin cofactor-binding domain-containing protein [Longimicrobiales bacterium]
MALLAPREDGGDARLLDRREFIKLGALAGGGLVLGAAPFSRVAGRETAPFQPGPFVRVGTDGTVTIWVARSEMGQGVRTALPMIVADELDADWSSVEIVQAEGHRDRYGRQMTVGSSSVRGEAWMTLRRAGATARAMLVSAAAARLGVSPGSLRTQTGQVIHGPSGRTLSYGELADEAAELPVPDEVELKTPSAFTLIGTRLSLLDTPDIVTGRAVFGIDARVPDMLYATVLHCPFFGGTLRAFDDEDARKVTGVRDVVQISTGIAVVATNTWAAFEGADALEVTWDPGGFTLGSPEIAEHLRNLARRPEGAVARNDGDAAAALDHARHKVRAVYEAPFLAHATMEPMNCTAHVLADRCEVWAPTQNPQGVLGAAARFTGLAEDRITVHVTRLGCGWGRRSSTDFVQDALETSKAVGAPVQVLWTREEDTRHDFYRPRARVELEGGFDGQGWLTAVRARVVATPIGGRGGPGADGNSMDGLSNGPYDIPNFFADYVRPELPVPIGYWRSVGPSQNTFFLESFIDELAHEAERDPVELRLEMLGSDPRMHRVLEVAAERSGWAKRASEGRARGVALVRDKGGRVAQVAEVSLEGGDVRVHRVTLVADCGLVIHPGVVEQQMA